MENTLIEAPGARQFRKKPVVIEAIQVPKFEGMPKDLAAWGSISSWLDSKNTKEWNIIGTGNNKAIRISTLEGAMIANPGDWVIRGVKGEVYPCKDDIFQATYELVE